MDEFAKRSKQYIRKVKMALKPLDTWGTYTDLGDL